MGRLAQHTLSTDWDDWQNRIRHILGVPEGESLRETDLVRPWFLVPQHGELPEDEAAHLFATVRRKLFGPITRPRVLYVIRCVRTLSAEDSLPLLYAMRHVARERGSIGRYWPAFHEEILDRQLKLRDVQVRLAPEVAQVWLRLYEETRGALYYPREGRRFIKWPLAHAGLLRHDEEVLRAFGTTLVTEYGGDPSAAPLVPDDLDEFLLALLDWLQQTRTFADSRLAHLVHKKDGTDVTIGELAQRWLRDQWEQVAAGQDSRGGDRARLIRRYLRYDAAQHRVLLVLRESVWPGDVGVFFHWGDLKIPVRTRFMSVENNTETGRMEIPILLPEWESIATLVVEEDSYTLRLPKPPGNRGLVFRPEDGRVTRRWQLGEEYYVLLPVDQFRVDMADVLFEEWVRLGPPAGEWDRYEVLWVRTDDPLQRGSEDGDQAGIAEVVGRLEEATERLRLPSFGHLWRPRLYLVGGTPVRAFYKAEVFPCDSMPWLEVRGIWDRVLPLTLTKWNEGQNEYVTCARLELPPPVPGAGQIVELWHASAEVTEGRYRLEIDSTPHASFELVPPPTTPVLGRFDLHLEVEGENGLARTEGLARGDLERATLVGRAWPHAELTLDVSCGTWARTLPIRADGDGRWGMRWRDLGVGGLPDGSVALTLSWRGLAKTRIMFADVPFVAEGDIEMRWLGHKRGEVLEVTAVVSNRGENHRAAAVVLGARPWDGQIWRQTVDLGDDGFLQARILTDRSRAHWLAILPPESTASPHGQQPWVVRKLSEVSGPWGWSVDDLSGSQWDMWQTFAHQLRRGALPPGLHDLLGISGLGLFLNEHSGLCALDSRWSPLDKHSVVERLATWIPVGLRPSMAIFGSVATTTLGSRIAPSPPYLRPLSPDELAAAVQEGGGEIALCCAMPDGSLRRLLTSLRLVQETDQWHANIMAREWIQVCCKCGLVLDAKQFWHHWPAVASLPRCTARGARLTSHRQGSAVRVQIAVLWDPGALLDCLTALILHIASGDESLIPRHAEPWLNQLEAAYYGQSQRQDAKDWLTGLSATAQRIWKVLAGGYEDETELVELGWRADDYRSGLDVLFRWLLSEMEWGNAAPEPR